MDAKNNMGAAVIRGRSSYNYTNHPLVFIDGVATQVSEVALKANYSFMSKKCRCIRSSPKSQIYGAD